MFWLTSSSPVVSADPSSGLELSFGEMQTQVFFTSDLVQATIQANLAARVTLEATVEGRRLRLRPSLSEFHIDVGRETFSGLNPEAVEKLLKEMLPGLVDSLASKIQTFPIPEISLAQLGEPDARLGLENASVTATQQDVRLSGDLTVLHGAAEPENNNPPWIGTPCNDQGDCVFTSGDAGYCHTFDTSEGPRGFCTLACEGYCPDQPGYATTFCVAPGMCVAQSEAENQFCAGIPGTSAQEAQRFVGSSGASSNSSLVCLP